MPACTANYLMQKIAPCARSFFEAVKILRRMLHILDLRGFIEMLRTQTDYAKGCARKPTMQRNFGLPRV